MSQGKNTDASTSGGGGMAFILLPLLLVAGVGVVYNNMANSGLTVSNDLTCLQAYPYTCSNSNSVGCQADPSQCGVQGNSISFLNQASPFTVLFTGNIAALGTRINSGGNTNHAPFDASGGGGYQAASCGVQKSGADSGLIYWNFLSCTNISTSDNSNLTQSEAVQYSNYNTASYGGTKSIPLYNWENNSSALSNYQAASSYTGSGSFCIVNDAALCGGSGLGDSYTEAGNLQVVGVSTVTVGASASTATVSDSNSNTFTMADSQTETCGVAGADTCWTSIFTAPNTVTGFIEQMITLSASTKASAFYLSCASCTTSGDTVEHAGSGSGMSASVGSFSPSNGDLVVGVVAMAGASTTSCATWTGATDFSLISPCPYGSFTSIGQAEYHGDYSGGATTVPISNSAGVGWSEDVIDLPFAAESSNNYWTFGCTSLAQVNYSSSTTNGFTFYGCEYNSTTAVPPALFSALISVPNNDGELMSSYQHMNVFIQSESWDTADCYSYYTSPSTNQQYGSEQCVNFINYFISDTAGTNWGLLGTILGFFIGIALFIIGLGLNLQAGGSVFGTGTSVGLGVNPQGSKLAQVLGMGLLIWIPLYSEFGGWINLLPLGLNLIMGVFVTGIFFFGLYERL